MAFERNLDYIDVASRLTEMRGDVEVTFPELTMQKVDMQFVNIGGKDYVVYTAAAYRTPDDQRPGIGTAWEPIPGPTSFTKDSEVQNAETAAWGRALVAIGAKTKNGIATAEEVTNRQGPHQGNAQENAARGGSRAAAPNVASDDPRIDLILRAAQEGDNEFLSSLASQFIQKGTLTEKQIESGTKTAQKIVTTPRSAPPREDYPFAEPEEQF